MVAIELWRSRELPKEPGVVAEEPGVVAEESVVVAEEPRIANALGVVVEELELGVH